MYGHYGTGKFKTVEVDGVKANLLTPDFSAAVQGYLDKMQARSPEGRAAAADADVAMTVTPDVSDRDWEVEVVLLSIKHCNAFSDRQCVPIFSRQERLCVSVLPVQ